VVGEIRKFGILQGARGIITVVRPGLCLSSNPIDGNRPCLLVMDSLGMHDPAKYTKLVKNYLVDEYVARSSRLGLGHIREELEEISERIQAMKFCKVPIPRQSNGYDCGVYVIKYINYVLEMNPSSNEHDITTNFRDFFKENRFSQDDIDRQRDLLRSTILNLSIQYKKLVQDRRLKAKALGQDMDESEVEILDV